VFRFGEPIGYSPRKMSNIKQHRFNCKVSTDGKCSWQQHYDKWTTCMIFQLITRTWKLALNFSKWCRDHLARGFLLRVKIVCVQPGMRDTRIIPFTLEGPLASCHLEILAKPCCGPRSHGPKQATGKNTVRWAIQHCIVVIRLLVSSTLIRTHLLIELQSYGVCSVWKEDSSTHQAFVIVNV